MATRAAIDEFLAQDRLALVGLSRDARSFSHAVVTASAPLMSVPHPGLVHRLHRAELHLTGRPECYRTGVPIVNEQLTTVDHRWPEFAPRGVAAGFRSVHALPMRLRGKTIGALNLFRAHARNHNLRLADVAFPHRRRPAPRGPRRGILEARPVLTHRSRFSRSTCPGWRP